LAAKFLRERRPESVSQAGDRLVDRAYALAVETGYDKHDRFQLMEEQWPLLAAAMPRLILGELAHLQTVCGALRTFLNFSGRWDELLSLERQTEGRAAAANDLKSAGWSAYHIGWVARLRKQPAEVLACAVRAEGYWSKANSGAYERASAIRLRGMGLQLEEHYSAAMESFRQSLHLFRAVNPMSMGVANVLNDIGHIALLSGDHAAAEPSYREALSIAVKLEDREGIAMYTGNLAEVALRRGDWPAAEQLAQQALAVAEEVGRRELIGFDCRLLGKAIVQQGRSSEALPYARRAVAIFGKLQAADYLAIAQAVLKECEVEPSA
jgi:tetratricopeptide (TPR) repeat protein